MKQTLRESRKEAEKQLKARRFQRDEEGRVILNMIVKNDDDFLSVFSENETPVISSDVADFIEERTKALPVQEEPILRIHSACIDEKEKSLYRDAIHEYYTNRYIVCTRNLRRNHIVTLFLTLFGISILAFEILFDYFVGNAIWSEVIDIAAWVLLWEAVDIGIFQNRSLRLEKRRCLTLLSMPIEYIDLS